MKEFVEKLMNWLANHHRVVKTDEDVEWNRAIYSCEEEVKRLAEEYKEQNIDQDLMIVASLPSLYPMMQPFEVEAIHRVASSAKYSGCWIPCSERLPNESERWLGHDIIDAEPREFIVMVKGAYEPTTGYYTVDGWVKDIYNKEEYGYADEIIAWMPLPEPFKPIAE